MTAQKWGEMRATLPVIFFLEKEKRKTSWRKPRNGHKSDCHIVFCSVLLTQFSVEIIIFFFSRDALFVEIIDFCIDKRSVVGLLSILKTADKLFLEVSLSWSIQNHQKSVCTTCWRKEFGSCQPDSSLEVPSVSSSEQYPKIGQVFNFLHFFIIVYQWHGKTLLREDILWIPSIFLRPKKIFLAFGLRVLRDVGYVRFDFISWWNVMRVLICSKVG